MKSDRIRYGLTALCVLAAIGLSFPLLPWIRSGALRRMAAELAADTGLTAPVVPHLMVMALLGIAAWLLPRRPLAHAGQRVVEVSCWAAGLVLISEPVISLALQTVAAWHPDPLYAGLLVPSFRLGLKADLGGLGDVLLWVLLPAVIEEFFFRARLLPALAARLGVVSAVSLSTLLFALAHGTVPQMVVCVPMGLLLGLLRLRCGNWYPCVLAHALHNALFLLIGGAVTASPVLPILLLVGGGWLVTYAWAVTGVTEARPRNRRLLVGGIVVALLSTAIWPSWRWLHDHTWSRALVAVAGHPRIDHGKLVRRLVVMDERGQLTPRRRQLLAAAWPVDAAADEVLWLRAAIDPTALAPAGPGEDPWAGPAYDRLQALWCCPLVVDRLNQAARRIAYSDPAAMAMFLTDSPLALDQWYERRSTALLALIQAQIPHRRRAVIALLFREWGPERTMAVLAQLPAADITPADRAAFRRHHPDPAAWVAADPLREPWR